MGVYDIIKSVHLFVFISFPSIVAFIGSNTLHVKDFREKLFSMGLIP